MSKLTNAPVRLASARIGRSRRHTARARALRVDRVELAVQRRQLDRDVDARDRPAVVAVDVGSSGQALTSRVSPASRSRYCF